MKKHGIFLLIAATIALAGCSAPAVTELEPTTEEPTDAATVSPKPTVELDNSKACEWSLGIDGAVLEQIPEVLISDESTLGDFRAIKLQLDSGLSVADDDLASALADLNRPFTQYMDQVDAGATTVSLDTSTVAEDILRVMELCVEAGFTVTADPQ